MKKHSVSVSSAGSRPPFPFERNFPTESGFPFMKSGRERSFPRKYASPRYTFSRVSAFLTGDFSLNDNWMMYGEVERGFERIQRISSCVGETGVRRVEISDIMIGKIRFCGMNI